MLILKIMPELAFIKTPTHVYEWAAPDNKLFKSEGWYAWENGTDLVEIHHWLEEKLVDCTNIIKN